MARELGRELQAKAEQGKGAKEIGRDQGGTSACRLEVTPRSERHPGGKEGASGAGWALCPRPGAERAPLGQLSGRPRGTAPPPSTKPLACRGLRSAGDAHACARSRTAGSVLSYSRPLQTPLRKALELPDLHWRGLGRGHEPPPLKHSLIGWGPRSFEKLGSHWLRLPRPTR